MLLILLRVKYEADNKHRVVTYPGALLPMEKQAKRFQVDLKP